MNARNDVDTRIHRICRLSRTTEEEMYMLGKALLTLFMHGKMNLPSCGKEYFLQPVSRFFFVR